MSNNGNDSGEDDSPGQTSRESGGAKPVPGADEVYCRSCGEVIKEQAEICPHCGVRQQVGQQAPSGELKNAGLAGVASAVMPGLGQIYNGEIGKGIVIIFLSGLSVLLMFVLVGFIIFPIVWIYAVYDAYKTAEGINAGEVVIT